MLRDKNNQRLFRQVDIKIIFPPEIFPVKRTTHRAGPHQGFNSDNIDDVLMGVANQLDNLYPFWNFELIELAPRGRVASYVFKIIGIRAIPPSPDEQSAKVGELVPAPEPKDV